MKKTEKIFKHKKKFGQNFLTDSKICEKIVKNAGVDKKDVIEIGPGNGILTKEILKRANRLIAVEKDLDLKQILKEKFIYAKNLHLVFDDFLKIDLKKLVLDFNFCEDVNFCANLPFYITSPIIVKILQSGLNINSLTFMVQKEMAQRLVAKPGSKNCGAISVFVHYFCEPKILFNVSKGSFFPAPKVDASIIKLKIKKEKYCFVKDEEMFFIFVRAAFSSRRKLLINPVSKLLNIKKETLKNILQNLKISNFKRAEELSLFELVKLFNFLEEKGFILTKN